MRGRRDKTVEHGTFSIVARCPRTGQLGVAVASKYLAVGARVPFVRAGVGAVATQARTKVAFGPQALELMGEGLAPDSIVKQFAANDPDWEFRQLHLLDARGRLACHTGPKALEWAGHLVGLHCTLAGNILTGPQVLDEMLRAFDRDSSAPLARRLVSALVAGDRAGGDKRGKQSAALLVADVEPYPIVDLRVDDHPEAPSELERVFNLFEKTFPGSVR